MLTIKTKNIIITDHISQGIKNLSLGTELLHLFQLKK